MKTSSTSSIRTTLSYRILQLKPLRFINIILTLIQTYFNSSKKSIIQLLAPDNEDIRLGIQRCHKTIKDSLNDGKVFHADGTDTLFLILRKTTELKSSEIGRYKYQGTPESQGNVMGLHHILGMLKVNTLPD